MKGNDAKTENNNEDLSQERKIVNDFKSELEKIKQKLAKDFYKFNEMEKEKEKEKETTTNTSDSNKKEQEIIKNTNIQPINNIFSSKLNNNENTHENILPKVNREEKIKKETNSELIKDEIKPKEEEPTSIFGKVPSLAELKAKYGINFDEPKNDINEKKVTEEVNLINPKKDNKYNKDDKENQDKQENNENQENKEIEKSSKTGLDKYDYTNILNIKKNNDDELQNIFNRKGREIIDIDDSFEDENDKQPTNHPNEINNEESNKNPKNNNNNKNIIHQHDTEEDEIDMINKYIDGNNNNNNCANNDKNDIIPTDINVNSNIKQHQLIIENSNNDNNKLNAKDLFGLSDIKTDINNNSNNNNLPKNYHYTKINTSENKENKKPTFSPNKSNINNITNNNNNQILDTSLLNSKLDQQIKLINEKSENNRIEEEKNQLKIREIENSLQLDKRLTHNNREIRKNAIKELCEMCQNFGEDEDDKSKAFECFSPWVKYCLEETNSYVIPESLNFFILFNSIFPNFLVTSMKDFFDNIERFVTFGISSINENCFKIIFLLFQDKKTYSLTLNAIFKLLSTSSMKMVKFLNGLLIIMIDNNIIQDNYVKILFEKLINIYVKIMPKLIEKKKIYSKLLQHIYQLMEDDWNNCKLYIKLNSYKELDSIFNKVKKNENQIKFRLYPQNNYTNDVSNNNNSNINNYNNKRNDKNLNNKIKRNENNNRNNNDNNNVSINNIILNNNIPDINDILTVLPNEFFEYHFLTQFQNKIKILEQTNEILNKIKSVKDKDKNLTDVYKTINYSIEDSNILIHLEGIKLLENICRLIQSYINTQKLKLLLETCFDKLKDKKSLVKNELFTLFNMIIENHCFDPDKFISFILQFCCNQKKENSVVKMGLLEYIKLLFGQENNVLFYEMRKIREKDYLNFTKKIVTIIQKESLSSVKDLCSDLLIIFKRRIENIDEFDELISVLPNHRKKIILEEENLEQEEGEYKRNLKRIKSSYSFSKTKYSNFRGGQNHMERSKSNARLNNFDRNESAHKVKNSFSSSKNVIKTNINNIKQSNNSRSKYNTKNHFKNNNSSNINDNPRYQTGGFAKLNNKKKNISSRGNISSTKNSSNNLSSNNNESKNYAEKSSNKNNKKENFNQKKDNLMENIQKLDIDSIDKYSRMIIKDFFIFVNKVCSSQTKNEDLAYHFNVIFMIFEKIFYRIIELVNVQKQKQQIIKLKKLLDELMAYISKAVIMTPCIDQIPGTKKFNLDLLEVFLDKIKQFCPTKEKFYMHLLLGLYKFCEQNQDFPKELNPKPSALFFLKYVKEGYNETKSDKLLNILKEFISETQILTNEEKKLLDFNDNNNDEEEEENEDGEQESNNIQKNLPLNSDIMNMPRLYNKQIENNVSQITNNVQKDSDEESNENIISHNNKKIDKDNENDVENNNIIKNDNCNNNNDDLDINQLNTNSIAEKLRQFEAKLNKIPKPPKDNTEDLNNNLPLNDNNKENMFKKISPQHNLQSLDIEEINSPSNMNDIKNNLYTPKSKLDDSDFQKIEESIRLMSKRLDTTLNKMNDASAQRPNSRKSNNRGMNTSMTSQKEKEMTSLNISKISENNGLINNFMNDENKKNLFNNNLNSEQIIEKIMKVVKNDITDNEIYLKAKDFFINLNSVELKLNFIKELRGNFDNPDFIANIPINTCTNFFDFVLSILSFQILNFAKDENIIINLQELAEYLLPYRKLNDMFIIMLFLLKKYFPKNLNNKIEDIALVMIKVISYLLKELLKSMNKENVIGQEIICEINDLFTVTPPSTLTTATPNALFYQHIFTLLKSITDHIAYQNKDQLENIIAYLQEKKLVCEDYIQYLIRLKASK